MDDYFTVEAGRKYLNPRWPERVLMFVYPCYAIHENGTRVFCRAYSLRASSPQNPLLVWLHLTDGRLTWATERSVRHQGWNVRRLTDLEEIELSLKEEA